jgi:hypothetical protein
VFAACRNDSRTIKTADNFLTVVILSGAVFQAKRRISVSSAAPRQPNTKSSDPRLSFPLHPPVIPEAVVILSGAAFQAKRRISVSSAAARQPRDRDSNTESSAHRLSFPLHPPMSSPIEAVVILSGAAFQAKRRACPKLAEGISVSSAAARQPREAMDLTNEIATAIQPSRPLTIA